MTEVVAVSNLVGERVCDLPTPSTQSPGLLREFVGGKVKPGAIPEEALVRECREDLEVTIQVGKLDTEEVHIYPDLMVRLLFYHA